MARFLIRRVLQGLFVMWLMTISVFLIFYVGPGPADVARVLAGREASPATVAAVAHRLLLDRPLYVQYGHFIWQLLHGSLGYDYYHGESVNTVLRAAFPITLSLVIGAAILWLFMGLGLFPSLSVDRREACLNRVAASRAYLVRQMLETLKIVACLAYFGDARVRRSFEGAG